MDEMPKPELPESTQEFIDPAPNGGTIPPEERQMAMFTHLSALSGMFTFVGYILGPLLVWQINKDKMPSLEAEAKEGMNFNITVMIGYVISFVLMFLCIGYFTALGIWVASLVFSIIAGLKANDGISYRYPLTIRFIK